MLKKVIKDGLHGKRLCTKLIPSLRRDLPYDIIETGQPPFNNTRIDYSGSILTKQSRRTRSITAKIKRCGALFTCLNTRAVHLETFCVLTADSFILALRRLRSRRGYPHIMGSDNCKNFSGEES